MPTKTNRPTRPASSSEGPDYLSGCQYVRVALCGVSLRQGVPVGLQVLVAALPQPMPPARGRTITVQAEPLSGAA